VVERFALSMQARPSDLVTRCRAAADVPFGGRRRDHHRNGFVVLRRAGISDRHKFVVLRRAVESVAMDW
jgi:hypothetical protein